MRIEKVFDNLEIGCMANNDPNEDQVDDVARLINGMRMDYNPTYFLNTEL